MLKLIINTHKLFCNVTYSLAGKFRIIFGLHLSSPNNNLRAYEDNAFHNCNIAKEV